MSLKLLIEHHLEFLSLNGGYVQAHLSLYTCQNATLFEITCHGLIISYHVLGVLKNPIHNSLWPSKCDLMRDFF